MATIEHQDIVATGADGGWKVLSGMPGEAWAVNLVFSYPDLREYLLAGNIRPVDVCWPVFSPCCNAFLIYRHGQRMREQVH